MPAANALTEALAGSGRAYLHISGSSVVGTQAGGRLVEAVYDEATPFTPSPGRAARAALNAAILARRDRGVRPIIICPSLIYGAGRGVKRDSMQIPWLIATARRRGMPCHAGPGENRWSNVHIDDLVRLTLLALERAPAGGFYFAENGENSMRELCQAIGRMLGLGPATRALSPAEAAAEWGENAALNTMGSNSRVRAVAARATLGWAPQAASAIAEIERGCYAG
jgi:nucleoside-diphosphate-sugar epimerase